MLRRKGSSPKWLGSTLTVGSTLSFSSSCELILEKLGSSASWFPRQRKKRCEPQALWTREEVDAGQVGAERLAAASERAAAEAVPPSLAEPTAAESTEPMQQEQEQESPDSAARRFAVEHGVPPYIVPADRIVAWSQRRTAKGLEVHLELDQPCSRTVEVWTVFWDTKMSGVITKRGEFCEIKGVTAAAAFLKGVKVKATKFACPTLAGDATMTISAKAPMMPAFPVPISAVYVLNSKGAQMRWLKSGGSSARASEEAALHRLSHRFSGYLAALPAVVT